MNAWFIMQRGARGRYYPYIPVEFATEKEARQELAELLRYCPPDHEWRHMLFVQEVIVQARVA